MTIAGCLILIAATLLMPERTTGAAREALRVWGLEVAPSLFPYMVLCRALAGRLTGRLVPARLTAGALGLLGGSPSGAAALSACAGREGLTRRRLLPLAALTGTLSPMFLLSTLRHWTGDARLCRLLFFSHAAGALLAFAAARLLLRGAPPAASCAPRGASPAGESGAGPIAESVRAILNVGGCIVFFSVVAATAEALFPSLPAAASAALHAALEAAGGMRALALSPLAPRRKALALAAASGFTGLSILTQNLLFLRPYGVTLRDLLLLSLLRALGCAAAMALLLAVTGS